MHIRVPAPRKKAVGRDIERIGLEMMDRAMWRLAQLLAAALVVVGAGTVPALFLVRKLFFTPPGA